MNKPNAVPTQKQEKKLSRRMAIRLETERRKSLTVIGKGHLSDQFSHCEYWFQLMQTCRKKMEKEKDALINSDACVAMMRAYHFESYFQQRSRYNGALKHVQNMRSRFPNSTVIPLP